MFILKWIGRLLVLLIVLAAIAYPVADWLRAPLDQAARDELLRAGKADKFVALSAGVMHVRVKGPEDGPTVLLVHGASSGGYAYVKWIEPVAAAGYRVVVPDLLGYGYSDRPDDPHTKAFYTKQLNELLDALGATKPVHIVGASMGGAIVTAFAAEAPARVKSVTLLAPAGLGRVQVLPAFFAWPVVGDWIFRVVFPTLAINRASKSFEHVAGGEGMTAWFNEQARFRGYGDGQLNTIRNYDILWQPEDYDALGRSGIPVLAFWGTADSTLPYELSKALPKRAPQLRLVTLEGKEHGLAFGEAETVLADAIPFWKANDAR